MITEWLQGQNGPWPARAAVQFTNLSKGTIHGSTVRAMHHLVKLTLHHVKEYGQGGFPQLYKFMLRNYKYWHSKASSQIHNITKNDLHC